MVCGSLEGMFSLGEVTYLPWQLYRTRDGQGSVQSQNVCTCGKQFQECSVWSEVIGDLSTLVGFDIQTRPFDFPIALLAKQRYSRGSFDPTRLLRMGMSISVKHRLTSPIMQVLNRMSQRAVINNWMMFDKIGQLQDTHYVSDSTKSPWRLWLLHKHRPDDVRVIILIRDVRAVAYSAIRRYQVDGLKRAAGWVRIYNRILAVLQVIPDVPVQVVRYEDLCADPEGTRAEIAKFCGLSGKAVPFPLASKNYHMVAGNPMRYKDKIAIRYDNAWRKELDTKNEQQIIAIARRLNHAWRDFGYKGVPFYDLTMVRCQEESGYRR